jgi:ankyrin repeat protein
MTPLHFASFFGHSEVVKFLANHGDDLRARTDTGFTAIHLACITGHLQVVKQYANFTKKEDRATMDEFGKYPIHYAAEEGFHEVIHLTLS